MEEQGPGVRGSKRLCSRQVYSQQSLVSGNTCQLPYCGVSFETGKDLDTHYKSHLAREIKDIEKVRARRRRDNSSSPGLRAETYSRLRERRLRRRVNQGEATLSTSAPDMLTCQVCCEEVRGSADDHREHVQACLRAPPREEEEEDLYLEYEGEYEEYEWAGQRRVRSTTLMPGGLAGAGFSTIQPTDESDELDVTGEGSGDDFGPDEYSEEDLHRGSSSRDTDTAPTRRHTVGFHRDNVYPEDFKSTEDLTKTIPDPREPGDIGASSVDLAQVAAVDPTLVIAGLQEEQEHLKAQMSALTELSMCRVCMDNYARAVVSTVCWHVHCESCWIRTLAEKKLCPQCKAIVKPTDLRRIYI